MKFYTFKKVVLLLALLAAILGFSVDGFAQADETLPTNRASKLLVTPDGAISMEVPPSANFTIREIKGDRIGPILSWTEENTYLFLFTDRANSPEYKFYEMVERFVNTNGRSPAFETGFSFKDGDGFSHKVLIHKNQDYIYSLHTISLSETDPVVDRFFSTLRIDGKEFQGFSPSTSTSLAVNNNEIPERTPSQETAEMPSSQIDQQKIGGDSQTQASRPFTIVEKPKALYTEFAKEYMIYGSVMLRVTFQSDGTIGPVEVLSKLPFGLVGEAVNAAKHMKFVPQYREGKPITSVRKVEYIFTIF